MTADRIPFESCPLCGSHDHVLHTTASCAQHPLFDAAISSTMQWRRCKSCTHIFTDGFFTAEALAVVFGQVNVAQMVGADMENQRAVLARMIEKILPFSASGSWFDVGFGSASLLFTASEYGFTAAGVDLRAANVGALLAKGVQAECVDLLDMHRFDEFAVISMADVIEHVSYPTPSLAHTRKLLTRDGVLFVSMPNADAPLWHEWNSAGMNP